MTTTETTTPRPRTTTHAHRTMQGATMTTTTLAPLDLSGPSEVPDASDASDVADLSVAEPAPPAQIVRADRPAGVLATATTVAGRTVRKFVRTPQQLVLGTVTGAMFLLIFRYVFGGAIDAGAVPYVDFLVPGYVVTSVLFTGSNVSVGVAEDMEQGFTDRLRSLPVPRTALLAGRVGAESALLAMSLAITAAIGFGVGFRIHGGVVEALAAFGLCAVFGFAFMWLFALLGLVAGNVQAAQSMSLLIFPLSFVSSAMVPVDSMPGWMQPIAEHQPVTVMTNAVRSLALGDSGLAGVGGHSTVYWVVLSLVWSAGLVAAFAPLAVRRYRRS
jgi:ABC-2 type transport system permease protein